MENDKHIEKDENNDGIDRAGFLKCMAWAGFNAQTASGSRRSHAA